MLCVCDQLTRRLCGIKALVAQEAARFEAYAHLWTRDLESALQVCVA